MAAYLNIDSELLTVKLNPIASSVWSSNNSSFLSPGKLKVARYSFSRPIPPKFEHKLRRHKQSFGKIATTVVLD